MGMSHCVEVPWLKRTKENTFNTRSIKFAEVGLNAVWGARLLKKKARGSDMITTLNDFFFLHSVA